MTQRLKLRQAMVREQGVCVEGKIICARRKQISQPVSLRSFVSRQSVSQSVSMIGFDSHTWSVVDHNVRTTLDLLGLMGRDVASVWPSRHEKSKQSLADGDALVACIPSRKPKPSLVFFRLAPNPRPPQPPPLCVAPLPSARCARRMVGPLPATVAGPVAAVEACPTVSRCFVRSLLRASPLFVLLCAGLGGLSSPSWVVDLASDARPNQPKGYCKTFPSDAPSKPRDIFAPLNPSPLRAPLHSSQHSRTHNAHTHTRLEVQGTYDSDQLNKHIHNLPLALSPLQINPGGRR